MKSFFKKLLHPLNFCIALTSICAVVFIVGLIIGSGSTMFFGGFMAIWPVGMVLLLSSKLPKKNHYIQLNPDSIEIAYTSKMILVIYNPKSDDVGKRAYRLFRKTNGAGDAELDSNEFYYHYFYDYFGMKHEGLFWYYGDNQDYFY